eukprot:ANDGO_04789.mRNA.1 hypothetical protein
MKTFAVSDQSDQDGWFQLKPDLKGPECGFTKIIDRFYASLRDLAESLQEIHKGILSMEKRLQHEKISSSFPVLLDVMNQILYFEKDLHDEQKRMKKVMKNVETIHDAMETAYSQYLTLYAKSLAVQDAAHMKQVSEEIRHSLQNNVEYMDSSFLHLQEFISSLRLRLKRCKRQVLSLEIPHSVLLGFLQFPISFELEGLSSPPPPPLPVSPPPSLSSSSALTSGGAAASSGLGVGATNDAHP